MAPGIPGRARDPSLEMTWTGVTPKITALDIPQRCHRPNAGSEQHQVSLTWTGQILDTPVGPPPQPSEGRTPPSGMEHAFFTCHLLHQVPQWPLIAGVETICLGSGEIKSLGCQVEEVSPSYRDSQAGMAQMNERVQRHFNKEGQHPPHS